VEGTLDMDMRDVGKVGEVVRLDKEGMEILVEVVVEIDILGRFIELEAKSELGASLKFLILALNLLSIDSLIPRWEVFIGVVLWDSFKPEFRKEFPPKVF